VTKGAQASRGVARTIVLEAVGGRTAPEELGRAVEGVFAALQAALLHLIGPAGFRALLARASHLIEPEFPWLASTAMGADPGPTMQLLADAVRSEGVGRIVEGTTALLGAVVALLFTFIGEDLTLRILRRVWALKEGDLGGPGPEER
jgi:hypothetical protein